jgi:hypothetical protein
MKQLQDLRFISTAEKHRLALQRMEVPMSESDFNMLEAAFAKLDRDCDTAAKAEDQLKREGLLDAEGQIPSVYREPVEKETWQ